MLALDSVDTHGQVLAAAVACSYDEFGLLQPEICLVLSDKKKKKLCQQQHKFCKNTIYV